MAKPSGVVDASKRRLQRRRAVRLGYWSEILSRWLLRLRGYTILAVRVRNACGEIDIIARRGCMLAVVEVKARRNLTDAMLSIGAAKQQRLASATALWLARNPQMAKCNIRFDAILVSPWRLPCHIPGAWHLDT